MNLSSATVLQFPPHRGRPFPQLSVEFSTEPQAGHPATGRWTRVRITQQVEGDWLCEKVRGPDPLDVRSRTVESLDEARTFFGGGWIVKELFAALDPVQFPRWN